MLLNYAAVDEQSFQAFTACSQEGTTGGRRQRRIQCPSPDTASRALQVASNYCQDNVSSTQESYGSVDAALDLGKVAKSRSNKRRKRDDH